MLLHLKNPYSSVPSHGTLQIFNDGVQPCVLWGVVLQFYQWFSRGCVLWMSYKKHHPPKGVGVALHQHQCVFFMWQPKEPWINAPNEFFKNYLAGTNGWKMPEYVTGCHSYILNKYSGHLEAQAPATNINNFELVAICCPKAQLKWKTKLHYPHSASENISLKSPSPALSLVSGFL